MRDVERALEILACPKCKGKLAHLPAGSALRCAPCSMSWPIVDGVPRFVETTEGLLGRAKQHWEESPSFQYEASEPLYSEGYYEEQDRWRRQEIDPYNMAEYRFEALGGKTILDIGCGSGWVVKQCAKHGAFAVGIDFTERAVQSTKTALDTYNLDGLVIQADAQSLPVGTETIDRVYSIGVLHHLPSTEMGVSEAHRIVKKGGDGFISLYGELFFFNPVLFPIATRVLQSVLRAPEVRDGIQYAHGYDEFYRLMDGPRNPIGRWYTVDQLHELMRPFRITSISRSHFPLRYLKVGGIAVSRVIPNCAHRILERHFGMMRNMQLEKRRCDGN